MELHRESLEVYRRHRDDAGVAVALTNLGEIARRRRQLDEALQLHGDSASLFAAAGDAIGQAAALTNLAATRLEMGALDEAHASLAAAAVLWQRADERSDLAECFELFTAIASGRGQSGLAVRLAAAAASLRAAAGTVPSPAEAARHEATLDSLERATEAERFAAEWEIGWSMTTDEAVALALA